MFSVRLVNADSYQAQPLPQLDPTFSEFRGSEIKHVPIIRIFGTTSNGEKTCLHIHGVFPYLYVPYTGEEEPASLAYRLAASLDAAINVSLGSATSNTQHVYLIQRVSGIPFYGYHRKEHQYLKIYFYNPAMIKRAADLLQNGSVLNQSLQPHEAHIPYILQFMMDYNVYGMSFVNVSSVKHRRLTQTLAELTSSGQSTTSESSDIEYLPGTIERQSTCELEIDALASDIVNRREIESRLELNPGLAAIWEEERARRAQAGFQGGDSQLVNPKSPPRPTYRPTDNDIYQEQRLTRRLLMISQCDESSLSTPPNQSIAYAAEVKEGENLLNSSNLLLSHPTAAERTQLGDRYDPTLCDNLLDSRTEPDSQRQTTDCSILGTDDGQLVELLVQLAGGGDENQDSIDLDSLLGSQVPALQDGEKSDNEEEDDDVTDLNLTSLQLDSLDCLEISVEQANDDSLKINEKNIPPTHVSPLTLSYESSTSSSRSANEEKSRKRYQVPQYDGAGDVSPTLLNSDDDENATDPKEFSPLPEYNGGTCDSASQSRKFDNLYHTVNLPSNACVTIKNSDKSGESCRSSSPDDSALQSAILPPLLVANEYMGRQYHDADYEPLDRLLEIGPDFVPDLEGLHSSMEIGILLSSADSDSPESVDDAPEDEAIALETVLNGDPCFTESAELDKSDLTELQDQYVSLLGNSLLPDVHTNIRIDSDLGNSSNYSDSDYQTGEKTCEILLNVPSPRTSIASRGSSSSSENVAPNIQEPEEGQSCTKDKFNASYDEPDRGASFDCKDSTRISTDNSDYNCNVVATWAELQNLQFVEKEKMEGRLERSKERDHNLQYARKNGRRANRRATDEKAKPSQILGERVTTKASTLSSRQDGNNYSLSQREIVTSCDTGSPIKVTTDVSLLPIGAHVTILKRELTESVVDIVKKKCPTSPPPRVPDIAAEVEVEQQTSFANTETCSRIISSHERAIGSDNDAAPDGQHLSSSTANCNVDEDKDATAVSMNRLDELSDPITTKQIPEGYSYYSSERSQRRDYKAGGFAHWHCQFLKGHKLVQDQIFTSDQVWVIEKRKRGRQSRRICGGVCMRGDCSVPIVPLTKIVDKNQENSITVKDDLKIEKVDSPVEKKTAAEIPEIEIQVSAIDTSAKKRIGPKNHSIGRKLNDLRNPTDISSSDSDEDVSLVSAESPAKENKTNESINEPISGSIPGNKEETKDPESKNERTEADLSSIISVKNRVKDGGDLPHNPYSMRRRYSRKKRSRVRNSKKIISIKSSRIKKNGLLQRVACLAKHENYNLPGIPGVSDYRPKEKGGRPRKDAFNSYNGLSAENMPIETPRKTKNKIQPVLLKNSESKREISSRRPNGLVNYVENGISGNKKNAISLDGRTLNSPPFNFSSVSPTRKTSPRDNSKDVSSVINRASTPKKVDEEIYGLTEGKLSECVALNLMMCEVKSRSTRAKLKILLEKRSQVVMNNFRDKETKITEERTSLISEKSLIATETESPIALGNPEFSPISSTEHSTKKKEIDSSENFEPSIETVTDFSQISKKILDPGIVSPTDVITDVGIAVNSTQNIDLRNNENIEALELFETEPEVLQNNIPEVNHVEELFNERKELSYQSDQFTTTIVENNLFSGNNYSIDAVSLEMPACLFEEDSDPIDKRSSRKIGGADSKISDDTQNRHDAYSDVSVDYRDVDVYDVESLTPSSSLATLNEGPLDGTEMSSTFSETTQSSTVENFSFPETHSVGGTCQEKSGSDSKSEGILDSSFEEASPEFEALSPSPKISDLVEPLEEEFAVHSTVAMLETGRGFDYSSTCTTDDSPTATPGGDVSAAVDNSALDHEIQDLVSQVVVQIENETDLPPDSESLFIEVLELDLEQNSKEIAENSEMVIQNIGKPEMLSRTEREKEIRILVPQDDGISPRINESNDSTPSQLPLEEINSFAKVTESHKEFQRLVTDKTEQINRIFESKGDNEESKACLEKKSIANDENYFVVAAQNYVSSEEELGSISKDALPKRSSKCRPVSIKLVNIDLTRFKGFRPKNFRPQVTQAEFLTKKHSLLSSAGNIVEENFQYVVPVKIELPEPTMDENKAKKSHKTEITWESATTLIGISDQVQTDQAIPGESTTCNGNSKEGRKFENTTPKESYSSIVISDESETFEMTIPIEPRASSENRAANKTKRMFKKSRLPARRSSRKCAEKTRRKLSEKIVSSTESQPSAEESDIITENDTLIPQSRLHNKSGNLLTHEITISESQLNTVFQSLKYASNGEHSSHLMEKESSTTVEVKAQENFTEKTGTNNSLECVLSMQKIPNEKKAPYVKWGEKCLDDSPLEINSSTEENTSADENVKPNTRLHVYSRKCYRQGRRKRRSVPPQLKLALQRRALQKKASQEQAKISPDSQTLLNMISSDKTDQEKTCSLQHRLTSQNIADTNTETEETKDPLSSDEKSETELKTLGSGKESLSSDLLSPINNRRIINPQFSQTPKQRHRSGKVPEVKPSIEGILEQSTRDMAVKKSTKTKVFSETIVEEKNEAIIFLEGDNSRNCSDGPELCTSQDVGSEESRNPTTLKRRDLRKKITKSKNRSTCPNKNANDVIETNSEGFLLSPEKITIECPEIPVGNKRKCRTKKMLTSSDDKPCSKKLPSQEEHTENTKEKTFVTIEESRLLSRKNAVEDSQSKNFDDAEVPKLSMSNASLEKNAQDIMENISQQVESGSEPEICVKSTKKRRPRKFVETNVRKLSADVISSTPENIQSIKENTSKIPEFKCKSAHKTQDQNIDSTILSSAESSILNASDLQNEISVENMHRKPISKELKPRSPKIVEKSEEVTCVKTKKRGRPRKVSVMKIEEPSTECLPNIVTKPQSVDVKNTDNYVKRESQEKEAHYTKSKTGGLNFPNLSPEQSTKELAPQKISEHQTEPEIPVKLKKRGRPRKISASDSRKPGQPKTQHVDEQTHKILQETQLSQNLEQDENASTNLKPTIPELSVSTSLPSAKTAHLGAEKISKVFPDSLALEPISTNGKYNKDSAPLTKEISKNMHGKVSLESDFPSGHSEENAESKTPRNLRNFHPNNQKVSAEFESTPGEIIRDCRKEVLKENTSLFSNRAPENVEPITFVRSTERNRSRKRQPDNALLLQSQPLMEENDRGVDSEKTEIFSQTVEVNTSEMKIITPRRGRSEKSPEAIAKKIHREDNFKSIGHGISETSGRIRETDTRRRRRRSRAGKTTDTNKLKMNIDSAEENFADFTEQKSLVGAESPPKITPERVTKLARAIQPRGKKFRSAKITKKPKPCTEKDEYHNYDIADETSKESPSLLSRIREASVETESRNTNKNGRQRKISTTIIEETSQESTSSFDEMGLKLSSEKVDEASTESRTSVKTKRSSRTIKKTEFAEKGEELSNVIATNIIEDASEPKYSSRSLKRTRSEKSPEGKPDNFVLYKEATRTIFEETQKLAEPNLSAQKVPNAIFETQLTVSPQKRVRFDEESSRRCTEQGTLSESFIEEEIAKAPPNKHKKYLVSLNGDPSRTKVERSHNNSKSKTIGYRTTRTNNVQQQRTKNPAVPEANNGVVAKSEFTISSCDNASLDLPSLQEVSTRHRRHENLRVFPERATKSTAQEQAIQSDEKEQSKEIQPNDLELGPMKKIQFFMNSEMSLAQSARCRSKPLSIQNQEPNIILQRLSRGTLKSYGIKYNVKNKTFVKNLKKHRPDTDYQVPAYDGPADLSSSESEDDTADVTVAREEKRVCVYQSGKKAATNPKRESIVTPSKRKIEALDVQSPTSKRRAKATPGPCSKTPIGSPNRTSMLRSPARVSGYYPPLPIIITSPKVRKESSETQDANVLLENREIPVSTSACLTPRRKNQQRLHENLFRGRISAMKSPKNVIGDKRATPLTMGSQRPGELDEIKWSEEREQIARNISTITSECDGATGNHNFTFTLGDAKDVRKKLVFSTAEHERQTDQIPKEGLDHQSTNIRTSGQLTIGHRSIVNDARKSVEDVENLANHETTALDPQSGPSHSDRVPVDENLDLYQVTTDEDSENDDVGNVTFTQYIDSQIEKNQVLTLDRDKIAEATKEVVSLRPKFNPPNSQRIIDTMESYGIPKYRNQKPFFGNEADVVKQKELAQKMLKVPGKGFKDLPSFISSVEGVTGIARWRKMKINEFQPALVKSKDINTIRALVGDDIVSLTPLIKPPSQKAVGNWLRARHYLEKRKKKENEKEEQEKMVKKTRETRKTTIQGKTAATEDEECKVNDSDVSVIEASPEKTVGETDSENMENCTLKMKIATKKLLKKAEDLEKCRFISSESEKAKDSVKTSASGKETSVTQNSISTQIERSLLSVLEKSDLFKEQEASRHLGVSCGQIEFLSDSTRSNVANENLQNAKALTRYQYLTIMCLEVHVSTRGDLLPDAQYDSISAIFYSVQSDVPPTSNIKPLEHGVIVLADEEKAKNKMHYSYASKIPWSICFANNEEALLNALVTLITRTDPEILIGWELETLSWGYVFQRATRLGMNLSKRISRIPATQCKWETPAPDIESMAEVKLPGRIVLDIWRMMRHEAALLSYTFESVIHHVLNERVPCPSFKILTDWWNLEEARPARWRVIEHYSVRVLGVFRMLDQLDIIGRTSELARLFGIQFYEVFSRGSQYRVESVMLRLAKPLNYIAVSPTPLQRASMRAMEALPLILEPESKFYSDPLIVLDFQSLYPSIIIAHNYCFSTCLGRIEHIGQAQPFEFGAYTLRVSKSEALKLEGKVNYAPCGVAYVKPEVRLGILPRMLTEILETRFMVKKAMKDHKQADKTLQRALHSRQHGLKFLANVTYGYTAANFSGRMPCIEVGDSVISKSKETLERAIKLVETTPKWGARVVYGDTDSLFILVPGKSKADAFVIGNEIADAVTASNLPPIKLKFEKVIYPSILQTKKRYCGYMYETPDQQTPTYLAKGIETVRRDGCPAVSKILEKTLKILFETKDVSLVKKYVTRQLDKVLRGKVSIQDLTFAKEFRGIKGYKAKACVPALELTKRLMRRDPRAIPRNSERVRYVIVAGAPNQPLIHCVRTPWELINDPGLRPNAIYYVTRVIIPPLNRCLNLMGVDVNAWYREMPHRQILFNPIGQTVDKQKLTIFQYFGTIVCVSCGEPSSKGICAECLTSPADTLVVLHEKLRWLHRTYNHVTAICQSCVGQRDNADCSSLECPVLYRRAQAQRELSQTTHLRSIIECGNTLEF